MRMFLNTIQGGRRLCLMTTFALGLTACSTIEVRQLPKADGLHLADELAVESISGYRIRAGDDLDIKFFYTGDLNESVKVRPDGFITMQLIDDVRAAGLTPSQLDDVLTRRYAPHLQNPVLSVIVRSFTGHRAYVGGEVGSPQLLPLDGGMTPIEAIFRAGGAKTTADMSSIVLIRKGSNGEPNPYQLDLSDVAVSEGRRDLRVALQPSDVLYVPRSRIANANLFVQQYVADLVLFKGVQLGFTVLYDRERTGVVVP